nr:retrovirus-related Pol polyprotein from transposon TNT 1-94 [Tanacetum cinerariifolium]
MNDLLDDNNFFIFDDVNVRISPVSKMPFRKKPCDSMHVRSKSNSNKSLPRTVHKWILKLKPLAEPVAKWSPRIVQICLWIIDSGCSKHMMGNRALLTNFVEKFLGMVRFGNNDFAVIVSYGDVVIGSMTIKKVYYVKDYEYYKTKMLLVKKDKNEQVLLAEDQAWMESSSDLDQEINANMVFMAQIKKVLSDSEASSSSADEKISEVPYYLLESESESKFETSEYYDNSTSYGLFVSNDDDQEIFHDAIESASESFIENHINS